jgi:hypothetical protein
MINRSVTIRRSKCPRYEINNPEECDEDTDSLEDTLMIINKITQETKDKYQETFKHTKEDDYALCNYEYEEKKEKVAPCKPKESASRILEFAIFIAVIAFILYRFQYMPADD